MTDPQDLRELLSEIAGTARPVDLTQRVHQRARALRRRRTAAGGVAGAAVIGAGGFAWSHAPGTGAGSVQPGAATPHPALTPRDVTMLVAPSPTASIELSTSAAPPNGGSTATSDSAGASTATPPARVTARPPAALPPHAVPAGHGCANAWTDEQAASSPFASSAQREQAATMGTALCAYVGAAKVTTLTEWISMGGLQHDFTGVTYDIQVTGGSGYTSAPNHGIFLAIFRGSERGTGGKPVVSTESGALRAQWPDGTVVLMTSGEDGQLTRAIIADPVFDAFR